VTDRRVVLVGGGARSGKSAFALVRARELGARRLFVATARRYDAEMSERIDRHRAERGPHFDTIEEPLRVAEALLAADAYDVAVVDCLTLWLSNLLIDGVAADAAERRVDELAKALGRVPCHVILVTNEVGMGLHPDTPLGRTFRDLAGRAHQKLSAVSDEVHFAALGLLVRLKPTPLEVRSPGGPT
jgi:adenosylcobinamide kinase / adenosylcobinamide-phosphate guanylyltransferase